MVSFFLHEKIIESEHPAVNELDQTGSMHEKDIVRPEAHGAHEHLESHVITTATFYEGKNCQGEIKMVKNLIFFG